MGVSFSVAVGGRYSREVQQRRLPPAPCEDPSTPADVERCSNNPSRAEFATSRSRQIQPVEAFDSTSSVNNSEGFFQL